jgi:hypothetical protein
MKRVVQLPNFSPKVNWFLTTFCLAAAFSKLPCGFAVFGQLRTQMFKFFFRTGFLPLSPQAIVGAFWGAFDRQGRRHSCPPPPRGGMNAWRMENRKWRMAKRPTPHVPSPLLAAPKPLRRRVTHYASRFQSWRIAAKRPGVRWQSEAATPLSHHQCHYETLPRGSHASRVKC